MQTTLMYSLCLLLAALFVTACQRAQASAIPYVDLSQRAPVPVAADAELVPLRMAVAAIISPQGTAQSYAELAGYLGRKLKRPVELVQRRTYAEVNDLVAAQTVDVAFVCTSAYVDGHDAFGMQLLVAPQIDGALTYHSDLIVPAQSAAQSMRDLQGKVFAFTDPMSFSGRVYPTYLVQQAGSTPGAFFSRTFFTYSHDKAIEAVAAGVADGAAVDSLVLDYALKRDPTLAQRVHLLERSPAFGIPPVVVPPDLPPRQMRQIQEILLAMDQDAEGRRVLADLGIDRFVPIDDQAYASVRALTDQTEGVSWKPSPSN